MVKDRKDFKPVLVKLGVALLLSLGGFIYSQLKTRRTKFNQPPQSSRASDHGSESDIGGGKTRHRDDLHKMEKTPSVSSVTSITAEIQEESYVLKTAVDNSVTGVSPGCKPSSDRDVFLLPEFNDLVREFDFFIANAGASPKIDEDTPRSDVEISRATSSKEKDKYEEEIRHLKHKVRTLRERERKLEGQLIEFYGLKEHETAVSELQNRLKINNVEAKFLSLKIESLQRENRKLQEQVADHAKIVAELDAARTKIKLLKKKLRTEFEHNRDQILTLQRRVSRLQDQELNGAATTDSETQTNLQRLKDLETEAEELRKSNLTLHLENSELAHQLESTQIIANSVVEDAEVQELRELSNRLREENDELTKEIEQLQLDRCADCEELVYLRWINACLRYELRNFQSPLGKTVARDLSKSLSPKSEEKAKQLILEYASKEGQGEKEINIMDLESDRWSSSQAPYFTDSADFDDSSQSSKANSSIKMKFFNKLRRVLRGKDIHDDHHRYGGVEDSDSDHGGLSSSTVTTSDLQSNKSGTLSLNLSSRQSSRHSTDFQRLRSTKMDNLKDAENIQRNSDVGSSSSYSSNTHRRFSSRWGSTSDISLENRLDGERYSNEKSELTKYAEALKHSGGRITRSIHRKAVSLGSFEAFRHAGSE